MTLHSFRSRALAICSVILLLFLTFYSGRIGFSRLLSTYADRADQPGAANAAGNLSPGDPEAHFARAALLEYHDDLNGAVSEYEQAIALRSQDYVLWLNLARARELNGDVSGAIAAARQAAPLAPFYAQPHWQLGNLLVRAGQRDEGFSELRRAAASDATLLPSIIDLAWQLSGGDTNLTQSLIAPQSAEARIALANYFRKREKVSEAMVLYLATGDEGTEQRRQFLNELINSKHFEDAYALWSMNYPANLNKATDALLNPGFEEQTDLDPPGFGWRSKDTTGSISLFLDSSNPRAGSSSLGIEFKGDSDPAVPAISQLVLISPHTHYQLRFAARTEKIVSGGMPIISVVDAVDNQALGSDIVLPEQTSGWQDYTIDFNSKDSTKAILISCRRASCGKSPCPIFGRMWLDDFSLQK